MAAPERGVWRKRVILTLASTALSLAIGEVAVRALGVIDPAFRDVDPVLGWAPTPGVEGWWTREGHGYVAITEHGFRGVDVAPGPPREGVLRVAILGDSFTEARQVALEDAYPSVLEGALDRCRDEEVEVLAFGVSGYGPAQERLLFEHRVAAYRPDVVLLAFFTGNDVADAHPALRSNNDPSPYYSLEDGELVLDASFRDSEEYRERASTSPWLWLRRSSHLVRLVVTAIRHSGRERGRGGELGIDPAVYSEPRDATWRDAWARTEAIVEALDRDVRAQGARFFVVSLTNAVQVDPDPAMRERYREEIGAADLMYPDRRIEALGARAGIPVLLLVPLMRAHAEREQVQLHGFANTAMGTGHWNERGHRVAAEEIARWLCAAIGR